MALKVITSCIALVLLVTLEVRAEGTIYPCPKFGLGRVPHTSSCEKYVQCFAGEAVVRDCANGLEYSVAEKKCMAPEDAQCTHDRDLCPLFNDPTNLVFHQDEEECGKYFLCYDNKLHEYECADGLHWDTENEWCAYPEEAECTLYNIECSEDFSMVPHPFDCTRYYYCLGGVAYGQRCPVKNSVSMIFDIISGNCNFRENGAVCVRDGGESTETTPTVPTQTTPSTTVPVTPDTPNTTPGEITIPSRPTDTTPTTTTQTTPTTTLPTTTTTEETTPSTPTTTLPTTTTTEAPFFECPSKEKFEVFPHPTRGCKWYVICESGVAKEGECPLYTIYNDRMAICSAGACA